MPDNKIETIESHAFYENIDVSKLLVALEICSRTEAKRLIKQGAVEIDSAVVSNQAKIINGSILKVGKHIYRQLNLPPRKVTIERTGNEVKILAVKDIVR